MIDLVFSKPRTSNLIGMVSDSGGPVRRTIAEIKRMMVS